MEEVGTGSQTPLVDGATTGNGNATVGIAGNAGIAVATDGAGRTAEHRPGSGDGRRISHTHECPLAGKRDNWASCSLSRPRPQDGVSRFYSSWENYETSSPARTYVQERRLRRGAGLVVIWFVLPAIGAAIYYPLPLHLQTCFKYLGVAEGALPESERACHEVLALPVYPELPEEQVRYVAQELRAAAG